MLGAYPLLTSTLPQSLNKDEWFAKYFSSGILICCRNYSLLQWFFFRKKCKCKLKKFQASLIFDLFLPFWYEIMKFCFSPLPEIHIHVENTSSSEVYTLQSNFLTLYLNYIVIKTTFVLNNYFTQTWKQHRGIFHFILFSFWRFNV